MTRPQKETDMKREHRVTIRLTDTEFSIIENAAEQAEMSISEYMRTQTMEGQVNARFEIVADVAEIKKLIGEFGKIGSNLNQIARHLNEWRSPYPAMAKELQDAAADLATLKFEVMKKVGDAVGNIQAYKL